MWTLHLRGRAELHGPPGRPPLPLAAIDAAWLGRIALGGELTSATLATLVWPAADERGALNNLRQRLHRLRKATGARLLEMTETARLAGDLQLAGLHDTAALALRPQAWDGELLAGTSFDDRDELAAWLATARLDHQQRRRAALAEIASAAEQAGELDRALAYAVRLAADDALSEHAHRRLMRLHYLRGDRAAAMAAFDACERVLRLELGLAPGAETLALRATIGQAAPPAALAARPVPVSLLRPPRAVGRMRERQWLSDVHQAGGVALLVGEAGMGKTRLLQDFAAAHAEALYVQARPGDAGVPYGTLARWVRAVLAAWPGAATSGGLRDLALVVPELVAPGIDAPSSAGRLQAAIERLCAFSAAQGRRTFIFDDLHFADRASLEMLRAVVGAGLPADPRWVFAHRPSGAGDPDDRALQALAELPRSRWIALAPLTQEELAELIDDLDLPPIGDPTLAVALWAHTGGNPLYALETLRAMHPAQQARPQAALALPRPESIAHLIDGRLRRLSDAALTLGRVAAIAGADFSPELAEDVLGTKALWLAGAWAELEGAGVLRGNAFAHDLVRDGMLRATPDAIAGHAHRQLASHLADRGAEPARIAEHWEAGGRHAEAARAYRAAARRAGLAARPREQALLLERAATAFAAAGARDESLTARIDAVRVLLVSAGVAAALAAAAEVAADAAGTAVEAAACLVHAEACLWSGRAAEAEASARRAAQLAERDADEALRLDAGLVGAQACGLQGRAEEGLAALGDIESRFEQIDDAERQCQVASVLSNLMIQSDRPLAGRAWTLRHDAAAERSGNAIQRMTARMDLAAFALRRGDLEAGIGFSREVRQLAPPDDEARSLANWSESGLGFMLCGVGCYAEGLAILERERGLTAAAPGALRASQEQWLAQVLIMLGQTARAQQLLGADEGLPSGMKRHKRLPVRAALARALGHDDARWLREALAEAPGKASRWETLLAEIELARHEAADAALATLRSCSAAAGEREYRPLEILAGEAELRCLLAMQRGGEAARTAEPLEALARRWRHPVVYAPGVLLRCAEAYGASGRLRDAERCLAEAWHWVQSQALPQVPEAWRDGFLQRNSANVALRAAIARGA